MKTVFAILLFVLVTVPVSGQILLDQPLKFTGTQPGERQVNNLQAPASGTDAINAATVQRNTLSFAVAGGNANNLLVNIPMVNADTGLTISVKVNQVNTGPVDINLNNTGAVPLTKYGVSPLDSGELKPGMVITALYDGTGFQLLSPVSEGCPSGFVQVTKDFCIMTQEYDSLDYFGAQKACFDLGGRLCSMSEWYYACLDSTNLGLQNMVNNYEWTGTAANNNNAARAAGLNGAGVPGCDSGASNNVITVRFFRCCYSTRK